MAAEKRQRSNNFTEHEKTLLKTVVSRYPITEEEMTQIKKMTAWQSICNEFNANEQISTRTIHKLQVRTLYSFISAPTSITVM